jgi:hypothetical protein
MDDMKEVWWAQVVRAEVGIDGEEAGAKGCTASATLHAMLGLANWRKLRSKAVAFLEQASNG